MSADQDPDSPARPKDLTRVLQDVGSGLTSAEDELLPLIYGELRRMAAARMQGERADHTLQATALVHEAYMRLSGDSPVAWDSRAHFFGAAARAMQRILVDHARARGRAKRQGDRARLPVSLLDLAVDSDLEQVLAIEEALKRLEERDARMAEIVRLRFYAGLSVEKTVKTLGISERTVRRDWTVARAWLARELGD